MSNLQECFNYHATLICPVTIPISVFFFYSVCVSFASCHLHSILLCCFSLNHFIFFLSNLYLPFLPLSLYVFQYFHHTEIKCMNFSFLFCVCMYSESNIKEEPSHESEVVVIKAESEGRCSCQICYMLQPGCNVSKEPVNNQTKKKHLWTFK